MTGRHATSPDVVRGESLRIPGDLLLHPVALVALGLVILNDRVLKHHYPGAFTGKLSDFAGLIYFPLFVVASAEAVRWVGRRRPWQLGPRVVATVSVVVGISLVLIKAWDPAAEFYRSALGVLLWPAHAIGDLAQGRGVSGVRRVRLVQDKSDLIALVALLVPAWISIRVTGHRAVGRVLMGSASPR